MGPPATLVSNTRVRYVLHAYDADNQLRLNGELLDSMFRVWPRCLDRGELKVLVDSLFRQVGLPATDASNTRVRYVSRAYDADQQLRSIGVLLDSIFRMWPWCLDRGELKMLFESLM